MNARAIACGLALAASPAAAQQPSPPPPDVLGAVVMTMTLVDELRIQCSLAFPEMKPEIEEAWRAWPLAKTTVTITVNGRPYVSPSIARSVAGIRVQFASGNEAKNRTECEGFKARLESLARTMPKDAIAPFLLPPPDTAVK